MVIQCSSCEARFKLADDKIKPSGTKVRCAKCQEVFVVYPSSAVETSETAAQAVVPPKSVEPPPASTSADDEFSFDLGAIAASASSAAAVPADKKIISSAQTKEPDSEKSPVFAPLQPQESKSISPSTVPVGSSEEAFNAATADSDALSFEETSTATIAVAQREAPPISHETFTFDSSSAPVEPTAHRETATPQKEDDFSFEFSEESGFGEFSFDAPPQNAQQPSSDNTDFSLDSGGGLDEFSWDDAPATTAPGKEETVAEPSAEKRDTFDFGSLSFDDDATNSPAPAASTALPDATTAAASGIGLVDASPAKTAAPFLPTEDLPKNAKPANHVKPARRPLRQVKRKTHLPFDAILKGVLVLLVLAGAYLGFLYKETIQVGFRNFLNHYIEGQAPREAQGQISLSNLSGTYISNSREGELLVIRGEAKNEYTGLRSSVTVRGTLYGPEGKKLQEQTVFCGNVPNDDVLSKASYAKILELLNNEVGDSLTNLNIPAGKSIPFTIVFKNVPKDLSEFSVELVDSKPGSK